MNESLEVTQLLSSAKRYQELRSTISDLRLRLRTAEADVDRVELEMTNEARRLFSPEPEEKPGDVKPNRLKALRLRMDAVADRCTKRLGLNVWWSFYGKNQDGKVYLRLSTILHPEMNTLTVYLDKRGKLCEHKGKLADWITDPADLQVLKDVLKG